MLVCNVSLRPSRRAIAAGLAEIAAATDNPGSGQVVFATLVDDPASVGEIVDAYLGEIMLEAASAADNVTAGSVFAGAIDESVTALSVQDATTASALVTKEAMIKGVFVNSDGTPREANVNGIMVNV